MWEHSHVSMQGEDPFAQEKKKVPSTMSRGGGRVCISRKKKVK